MDLLCWCVNQLFNESQRYDSEANVMKKYITLLILLILLGPSKGFSCSCLTPSSFCESITDENGQTLEWVTAIVRAKLVSDTNRKDVQVSEVIYGSIAQSEMVILYDWCTLYVHELEFGAEYIFALKEFEGDFSLLNCAVSFLKIENEVVKGAIAPGINSMDYKDLASLETCGDAFKFFSLDRHVKLFPNPTIDHIKIQNIHDEASINLDLRVYDIHGRLILMRSNVQGILPEEQWVIDIESYSSGVYLFKISTAFQELVYRVVKVDN